MLECIKDIHPNHGPISGIHTGLFYSRTEKVFVISPDLIFHDSKLIEILAGFRTGKPVTLPLVDGIPQYTFGIYSKSLLKEIDEMILMDEKTSPKRLIEKVSAELIDFDKLDYFDAGKFINMNTPLDYERAVKIFGKV
jgi:molybdopterin-guanine dinucleotide biosynthesis protein A